MEQTQINVANLRCPWAQTRDEVIRNFHDHEWGKLNLDDQYLFEMLVLQLFQSGLNWSVILHKRENFRKAFKNFDANKVAALTQDEVAEMLQDASIIRNKVKINAAIKNAHAFLAVKEKYGSFAKYLQTKITNPIVHEPEIFEDVATSNEITKELAKKMKKDGFFFVGPVIIYSFLQSVGLINDHLICCPFKYHG